MTYYFSTSGGHTESIQFSFVGALSKPWLVGVTDPYDDHSPYHRWQISFSTGQLTRALGAGGTFRKLKVLERGTSPRIVSARVIGSRGHAHPQPARTSAPGSGCATPGCASSRVSTSARAGRDRDRPGGLRQPCIWPDRPHGSLDPAPRGRRLVVERRRRAGRVGRVRTRPPAATRIRAGRASTGEAGTWPVPRSACAAVRCAWSRAAASAGRRPRDQRAVSADALQRALAAAGTRSARGVRCSPSPANHDECPALRFTQSSTFTRRGQRWPAFAHRGAGRRWTRHPARAG